MLIDQVCSNLIICINECMISPKWSQQKKFQFFIVPSTSLCHWPITQWLPCVLTHTCGCCFATGKKIQCNTCKDLSNDFASRSFVGRLSESPSPKYNVLIVLITQNWYITLSNLNVIRSLQQAYKHALFYPGLWSYQSINHNLWSHLGTKLAKI